MAAAAAFDSPGEFDDLKRGDARLSFRARAEKIALRMRDRLRISPPRT